jgi:hypothetical protein
MLLRVEKPARYAGGELFAVLKQDADVRIALSYPDLYEIGMANHGIKILMMSRIESTASRASGYSRISRLGKELESAGLKLFTIDRERRFRNAIVSRSIFLMNSFYECSSDT